MKFIDIDRICNRYIIHPNGTIWNKILNKPMKQHICGGYLRVSLFSSDKYIVHRLVASMFINNDYNLPVVNHINGNKLDNRVENLEWCTVSYNTQHSYNSGTQVPKRGSFNGNCKLTYMECIEIKRLCELNVQHTIIGELYGTSSGHISRINTGSRRGYGL